MKSNTLDLPPSSVRRKYFGGREECLGPRCTCTLLTVEARGFYERCLDAVVGGEAQVTLV